MSGTICAPWFGGASGTFPQETYRPRRRDSSFMLGIIADPGRPGYSPGASWLRPKSAAGVSWPASMMPRRISRVRAK